MMTTVFSIAIQHRLEVASNACRIPRRMLTTALCVALAACTATASAATGTWTGGGSGQTWDTTATNWTNVSGTPWDSSNGPSNVARFGTANATAVVSGNVYASGIVFATDRLSQAIINTDGTGAIYLSSSTDAIIGAAGFDWGCTINAPIVLNSSAVRFTGNTGGYGTTRITGGITGTSNLALAGNHEIIISTNALNITGTITNTNTGNHTGIYTTISSQIGSGVADVKNDTGARRLYITNASNAYGTTTINAGVVLFGGTGSIGTGLVTVNAGGAVALQGATNPTPLLSKIATSSAGSIALDTNSSTAVDLTGFNNLSLGAIGTVTYSGSITPAGSTYRLGGGDGSLTISSALSGANELVASGAGVVTLSGASTYTGNTTLNSSASGALRLGVAEIENVSGPMGKQSRTAAGTIILTGSGYLQYSPSNQFDYSGRFSTTAGQKYNVDTSGQTVTWASNLTSPTGSLTLSRVGSGASNGTLILSGTNSYTGITTLQSYGGALSVATIGDGGVAGNLGAASSAVGNIVMNGRQATDKLMYTGVTASTNRGFTVGGDATAIFDITNATTALTISGGLFSVSTSYMTKAGNGTLVLSGTTNRGSGGVGNNNIAAGTLQFAKQIALENNDTSRWTAAKIPVASGATVAFNVGGAGEFTTANVTTLLTNLFTVNNNGMRAGSFIGFDTTNAAGGTFTIANNIANSAGTGGGAVGLIKLGTNSLELSGSNTYTGGTTISAGRLHVTSSGRVNGTSGITVNGAGAELKYNSATALTQPLTLTQGTLSGTGVIGSALAVGTNAVLSPGNSPGILTGTGGVAWNPGGTYVWEVNALSGTAGTNWDLLSVTDGGLNLSGLSTSNRFTLDLNTLTGGNTAGPLDIGYVAGPTYEFLIASYNSLSVPGSFSTAANSDLTGLFTISLGNWQGTQPSLSDISVKVNSTGTGLALVIVPEPGAMALAGIGVAVAGWLARRRRT